MNRWPFPTSRLELGTRHLVNSARDSSPTSVRLVPLPASLPAHELARGHVSALTEQQPVLASASVREPESEQPLEQGPAQERASGQVLEPEPEQALLREHCFLSPCPSRATRFPSIPERQRRTKLLT